jgi:hypothetical protein
MILGGMQMEQTEVIEISRKIQNALKTANNAHEAEAWANALKSFMIAVGIQKDLELKLANA